MPDDELSHEIPDDYLREIGQVVVSFNHLEGLIQHTLVFALLNKFSNDGRALSVFAAIGFTAKLNSLSLLLQIIEGDKKGLHLTYKRRLEKDLERCSSKRNGVLHHVWYAQSNSVTSVGVQARASLTISVKKVTLQELKEISSFINSVHGRLFSEITEPLTSRGLPHEGQ